MEKKISKWRQQEIRSQGEKSKRKVTPKQQLDNELAKLSSSDRDNLCIALVCYLRFGVTDAIMRLITYKNY